VQVSNVARPADWLQAMVRIQGPQSSLVVYGEDGQQESAGGSSYFGVILQNVTVDGWVVIVLLAIMAAISWVVMVTKGLVVKRVEADNADFLNQFHRLGGGHEQDLNREETEEDDAERESAVLLALSGKHDHFQSSTLYRIYHAGVQELHNRQARSVGAAATLTLTPQAVDVIKATMDATLVRENQKLNAQMVLLTIAISGGPFLGLLGTVVGVMITFAAIAASGDVNVNAIAPGIAAALVATVAGLAVAIPALFGYNWLGSKIREISADMQVFVDEFITRIAEQHGESRN
jgi:biopolymer transport protein ExbB